ncbi:MAG: AraC family transcriptional regulator [Verrucomicrobiota bacterium]|nr:AraC family transcriptional regulator [Verrucomicrobiota bacterium]
MPENTNNPTRIAELSALSQQLPVPVDYFTGRKVAGRIEPTEILCFSRLDAQVLEESSEQHRDYHHRYVLVCPLVGEGWVYLDAQAWKIQAGDALLFFPFQFHYFSEIQPESINWLFITFEVRDGGALECLRESGPVALDNEAFSVLEPVIQYWLGNACGERVSLALELFLHQLIASKPARQKRPAARNVPHADLLKRVNIEAFKPINRGLGLKELSRLLGLSESRLRYLFRETTGMSLGKHLRRLKILKACELLQRSELSVSEIAQNCGFDSVYTFSRAFKHYCRVSPLLYRRGVKRYGEVGEGMD